MSNSENSNNLEYLIQKAAFDMVDKKILDKNEVEKVLGVLASDGIYAMWVYVKSKKEINEIEFMRCMQNILENIYKKEGGEDWEPYLQKISQNLDKLLFTKQIIEQTLIYARYHAKVSGE